MNVQALKSFSDGTLSMHRNEIRNVDTTTANKYIAVGYVTEYIQPIVPTGTKSITANGEYDVTSYAGANVSVPMPTGTKSITANGTYDVAEFANASINVAAVTLTYNVNGGTGSIDAVTAIAGNAVELNDGTGITPPTDKIFAGWATTNDATESDVTSPLTVTENTTIYAVYVDENNAQ